MFGCVRVIALLFALFASAASAQVIPSGPWGSINYWGVGGLSQVLNPGLAGQCLTTQGVGSAPVWVNCQVSSLSLLPSINTNQFYGNVSGQFAPPIGVDVNTILNTVGYDISRPPPVESILYKSNVGPTFNWQALPPGTQGSILASGGPTNPPFWTANAIQANLTAICTTVGALLYFDTPSLQWKCVNPGAAGLPLVSNGTGANPTYQAIGANAVPTPSGSSLGGVQSLTCSSHNWFNTLSNSGVFGCAQPNFTDLAGSISGTQIPAGTITNAMHANLAAYTMSANNTNASAAPTDVAMPVIYPASPVTASTLQTAINNACANSAIVQLPGGTSTIDTTSSSINIAGTCPSIIIQGNGGITSGSPNGTLLSNNAAANDLFNVTTNGSVVFRDFAMTTTGAKSAATAGIRLNNTTTGLSQQVIERVSMNGFCNSIEVDNSFHFIIDKNLLTSQTCGGIIVTQPNTADQGNNLITDNKIWDVNGTAGATDCILWHRGSGMRVEGNRCLGAFTYGFHGQFDKTSGNDGAILINGNTFEVQKNSGIYFERTSGAQGAGTTIGQVVINGNFIQSITPGGTGSIFVATSAGNWVNGLTITNNTIQNSITPAFNGIFEIDGAADFTIANNTIDGTSGTGGIRVSGTSVNGVVANNMNPNTTAATKYPALSSTTTLVDTTGTLFANLPTTVAPGSQMFVTDGSPTNPITGSGTGATAIFTNGAWVPALAKSTWGVATHVGYTASITQATTVFMNGFGHETTEAPAEQVMPIATTLSNMRCKTSAVGGAAQTLTLTLEKNGADQALTTTISSGSTTGNDTTHTVAYAAGDTYSVKDVLSATTGSLTGITCSFQAQQ